MEARNERFRRLADSRGSRIQREIRMISSLADRDRFDYGLDDINELFRPIEIAIRETRDTFIKSIPTEDKE